jgi:predicted small lipoprotein YifL
MRIALPLTVSLLCLCLAGCGQKGPLFLPTEPPMESKPAATPAPDTKAPAATQSQSTQPPQSIQPK